MSPYRLWSEIRAERDARMTPKERAEYEKDYLWCKCRTAPVRIGLPSPSCWADDRPVQPVDPAADVRRSRQARSVLEVTEEASRKGVGVFVWPPRQLTWRRWPIRFMLGHDEYRRRTAGMLSWLGAVFLAWPHHDDTCICATEPNDPYAEDETV